jgi:excisionase family DNA binding protein
MEGASMNGARTNSNRHDASGAVAAGAEVALDEPLLDCEAAAVLLNVRVSWVRDAARQGHLPCLRVGRHLRFTRAMLEDWLAEQVAGRAGATRAHPRPANGRGDRSGRAAFRRSTQAALLASLAESPTSSEVEHDG